MGEPLVDVVEHSRLEVLRVEAAHRHVAAGALRLDDRVLIEEVPPVVTRAGEEPEQLEQLDAERESVVLDELLVDLVVLEVEVEHADPRRRSHQFLELVVGDIGEALAKHFVSVAVADP